MLSAGSIGTIAREAIQREQDCLLNATTQCLYYYWRNRRKTRYVLAILEPLRWYLKERQGYLLMLQPTVCSSSSAREE